MAEMRDRDAKHARMGRRRQAITAQGMRTNRQMLSRDRGHIYLEGTYAEPDAPVRRSSLTQEEISQIRQLRAEGKALLEIANILNRSAASVRAACQRYDIPSPNKARGGWPVKRERENDQVHLSHAGKRDLLADHDAGTCGRDCRLGRHGIRGRLDAS
jgi:hypothetical protein